MKDFWALLQTRSCDRSLGVACRAAAFHFHMYLSSHCNIAVRVTPRVNHCYSVVARGMRMEKVFGDCTCRGTLCGVFSLLSLRRQAALAQLLTSASSSPERTSLVHLVRGDSLVISGLAYSCLSATSNSKPPRSREFHRLLDSARDAYNRCIVVDEGCEQLGRRSPHLVLPLASKVRGNRIAASIRLAISRARTKFVLADSTWLPRTSWTLQT